MAQRVGPGPVTEVESGNLAIQVPSCLDGDWLWAVIVEKGWTSESTPSAPSGWELRWEYAQGTSRYIAWTKFASGDSGTVQTWDREGSAIPAFGLVFGFHNVNQSNPVLDEKVNAGSDDVVSYLSVNANKASDMFFYLVPVAQQVGNGPVSGDTPPADEWFDIANQVGGLSAGTGAFQSGGSSGGRTSTLTGSSFWMSFTYALDTPIRKISLESSGEGGASGTSKLSRNPRGLGAVGQGAASGVGELAIRKQIKATGVGVATGEAFIVRKRHMNAVGTGTSSAIADLLVGRVEPLEAAGTGVATGSADLTVRFKIKQLVAGGTGVATGQAKIVRRRQFIVVGAGQASGQAVLSVLQPTGPYQLGPREYQLDFSASDALSLSGVSLTARQDAIIITPKQAFCMGPKAVGDLSEGLIVKPWYVRVVS